MVVRRTVHHLRERPRHEREAVAAWIAIAIMAILLLAWGFFFFRGVRLATPQFPQTAPTATQATTSQNAAVAAPTQVQIIQVSSSTDDDSYNPSDGSNSYNVNTAYENSSQT